MADNKPKLLKFARPEPQTDKDEIIEHLRGSNTDEVVVLFSNPRGGFEFIGNVGGAANVLLFIERFKHDLLSAVSTAARDPKKTS